MHDTTGEKRPPLPFVNLFSFVKAVSQYIDVFWPGDQPLSLPLLCMYDISIAAGIECFSDPIYQTRVFGQPVWFFSLFECNSVIIRCQDSARRDFFPVKSSEYILFLIKYIIEYNLNQRPRGREDDRKGLASGGW